MAAVSRGRGDDGARALVRVRRRASPGQRRGLIAPNHLSAIDPALVGALCPRTIFYMAKAELSRLPVVGEALQWTGAFPVRQGEGDRESVRQAREIPRSGRGYRRAAELVGAEILRLWRQAAESVAAAFPAELPDGVFRAGPAYRPLRAPTMASPSTSVKKAAA